MVPLPPAATLATQLALLLLTANLPGYCGTQLLSSQLTAQRTARLAGGLDWAAMPVLLLQAVAGPEQDGEGPVSLVGEIHYSHK